ncbi:MAG: 16S rRNA (adenine(1518)-N(6)/adenine(1519)-N(6))-dimethyltransferase RsmA [Candidatus Euphemobacter frigidus]|nr:16S rRNA (adenine(1518)-N(6)/adenine(1519)-N(6))-dimethyltransferase RsmA [Candidatus Euphemobacter frigidus]MDP8276263.1 16S rRNA (adenine(1518)-N(6)/adenine(1519)-N(6))-dimethyltransferase RsmA [Candidatus Euphemobacter frigidus]
MTENFLSSPGYIRDLLKKEGLFLKRSRGQNFLVDRNVAKKILRTAELSRDDVVLEIGPGLGALTLELCRSAGRVIAVEWDRGLVRLLRDRTRDFSNLVILQENFLKTDPAVIAEKLLTGKSSSGRLKVVANLPYSISGPLLVKLLEWEVGFSLFVLMVQKEVGERIVSRPGEKSYGRLSVLCRMYGQPRIAFTVSRNSFFPRPRVDSVVVRFVLRPRSEIPVRDLPFWKLVVSAAFACRRKMLKNTLAADRRLGYTEEQIVSACIRVGIDPRERAERFSVEEFVRLSNALKEISLEN